VLAWDFVEAEFGWKVEAVEPVNYRLRRSWLGTTLRPHSVVVDFLYHPDAAVWADHHATTFLTRQARRHYENRNEPTIIFDDASDSCAQLLWDHLGRAFGYRNPKYGSLVRWANKTDSAKYDSVDEAIFGSAPALRINASLAYGDDDGYCERLIRLLRHHPVETVAASAEVEARYARFRTDAEAGLARFHEAARFADGIVLFDVDARGVEVPRYAPYLFYPDARYSLGALRSDNSVRITAMRNPWLDFPSLPLGKLFESVGGGGHTRVGAVVLRGEEMREASQILATLADEIGIHAREQSSVSSDGR
jgi:hypothetical protein